MIRPRALLRWLVALGWVQSCSAEAPIGMSRSLVAPAAQPGGAGAAAAIAQPDPAVSTVRDESRGRQAGEAGTLIAPVANSGESVCARDRYSAEQTSLTIYTLFDESLSMLLFWGPVSEAFSAFVRDPASAGINIGLKFFGTECSPEAYAVPDVPIGPLPQNAEMIAGVLASHAPLAQTPTKQAMQGAVMALDRYAVDHPNEKTVILLVTDASMGIGEGDPEDCYSTVPQAAEVATQALAASRPIETYVLGLGDGVGLNALSRAGGTGDALSADPAASAAVVEAIREIRRRALPCRYTLPRGAEQSPELVNLERVDATGAAVVVPGVGGASACDQVAGGWYYDNPSAPAQLVTCPQTCESFAEAREVNVIVGCPTLSPD